MSEYNNNNLNNKACARETTLETFVSRLSLILCSSWKTVPRVYIVKLLNCYIIYIILLCCERRELVFVFCFFLFCHRNGADCDRKERRPAKNISANKTERARTYTYTFHIISSDNRSALAGRRHNRIFKSVESPRPY